MTGINAQFSDNPKVIDIGIITGSYAAAQFPNVPCKIAMLKARNGNAGSFFIGESPNDLHWQLAPGDETGWLPIDNLNKLYFGFASGTSDFLAYWVEV